MWLKLYIIKIYILLLRFVLGNCYMILPHHLYLYLYFNLYLYLYLCCICICIWTVFVFVLHLYLSCILCREIVIRSPRSPRPHHLYFIHADIYFLHFIFGIFYIWYLYTFSPHIWLIFTIVHIVTPHLNLMLFIFQRYFEAQTDHEIIRELTRVQWTFRLLWCFNLITNILLLNLESWKLVCILK